MGRCHTSSASASRAFSPPENGAIGFERHVAAKIETAEEIAQFLLARARVQAYQMLQRRFVRPQHLDLVLREIADGETLAFLARAGERRELCPPGA